MMHYLICLVLKSILLYSALWYECRPALPTLCLITLLVYSDDAFALVGFRRSHLPNNRRCLSQGFLIGALED